MSESLHPLGRIQVVQDTQDRNTYITLFLVQHSTDDHLHHVAEALQPVGYLSGLHCLSLGLFLIRFVPSLLATRLSCN